MERLAERTAQLLAGVRGAEPAPMPGQTAAPAASLSGRCPHCGQPLPGQAAPASAPPTPAGSTAWTDEEGDVWA